MLSLILNVFVFVTVATCVFVALYTFIQWRISLGLQRLRQENDELLMRVITAEARSQVMGDIAKAADTHLRANAIAAHIKPPPVTPPHAKGWKPLHHFGNRN